MKRPLIIIVLATGLFAARPVNAQAPEPVSLLTSSTETNPLMHFRANAAAGDCDPAWTTPQFSESGWAEGEYGAGFETVPPGAQALIETPVPAGSRSIYTRSWFFVNDPAEVGSLWLGADYSGGYVVWINGVEVFRSPELPGGPLCSGSAAVAPHAPSGAAAPVYAPVHDISAAGIPLLHAGFNLAAIGVWSGGPASTSLLLAPTLYYVPAPQLPAALTRGAYLQLPTPTGMTVRWRTSTAENSRVRYGATPASLTQYTDVAASVTDHIVTLSGLTPDTTYYYSIGNTTTTQAGDATYYFHTPPPAGTTRPHRIWVIGDAGTASTNQAAVRDAFTTWSGARDPDVWLMLGDNAYNNGTDAEFQTEMFNMYPALMRKIPAWSCYGNHDSYSADSNAQSGPYYDMYTFPKNGEAGGVASGSESYYSFDYGNIHFISLDAMDSAYRSPSGAQMTWLQQDLAAVVQPWIIAFWHHPPYTKGSHDSDTEIELLEMRTNFLPVLEQAGVDLVLGGHSHSYERSYLIDGHYGLSGTFTPAMKKDGGDGRPAGNGAYKKATLGKAAHEGAVYAVAGSSGQTAGGPLNHPAMYISLNTLGSMVLDVNGARLDAKFLTNTGAVADSFTLLKGAATPRAVPDGKFILGTPMKTAKNAADGSSLTVHWDTTGCRTSTQYQILWGKGSGLSAMAPFGAACNIGLSGSYAWSAAPAVPAGESFIWWTVVGTDGAGQEGSWGKDSAGAEEHGSASSGLCAIIAKNTGNSCP